MAANPTVFVTSATGSPGSALCRQLRDIGWNVRATTRNLDSPTAQSLREAGVDLTAGDWDDEESLRQGLKGCDKLFLILLPNLSNFDQAPGRAELITRLAKEAGVSHAVASTTLGTFFAEQGYVPPVELGPFFEAHVLSKQRIENCVIHGGFDHWTVLRPSFFMANFVEPKIQFGYTEIKTGRWTTSLAAESSLGLVDHVDIGRFAVAAFQRPDVFDGKKLPIVSEEVPVQEAMDEIAAAIGDGRHIKATFMTDEEIAKEQARGSWLFFSSEPCLRHLSDFVNMEELRQLVPELTTLKQFLSREAEAVKKTYLS